MRSTTIDLLCKVVDNYGDAGVVYRLAKSLSEADPELAVRILTNDLQSFAALAPEIDPVRPLQKIRGWLIADWRRPEAVDPELGSPLALFQSFPPRRVIECFACGRPEWYDGILFDSGDTRKRLIVNLEYLSAEDYAKDFHRLPSVTRSGRVTKVFFMPGFEPGTGGLIQDRAFREAKTRYGEDPREAQGGAPSATLPERPDSGRLSERRLLLERLYPVAALSPESCAANGGGTPASLAERFWISVFTYERDYGRMLRELAAFQDEGQPILVLAAAGRSSAPFLKAWKEAGRPFPLLALPFLPQESWDEVLLASDLLFVRGEESLARAALSGRPFVWHAYLQEGAHQLVKVEALIDRMRPHFVCLEEATSPGAEAEARARAFSAYAELSRAWNDRLQDGPGQGGEVSISALLKNLSLLEPGFRDFSKSVSGLGDLGATLLTFIDEFE